MRELLSTDHEIASLATRQYGVVASRQLESERRRDRRPEPLRGGCSGYHRGVYAVGHSGPGAGGAGGWSAVLACGDDAVLSHRSAATFWGIRLGELFKVEVTTEYDQAASRRSRRHRGRTSRRRTAPSTAASRSPAHARTLADLAHVLDHDELTRALREAMFRRLYDPEAIQDALTQPAVQGAEGPADRGHGDAVDDGGPLPDDLHPAPPAATEDPAPHRRQALTSPQPDERAAARRMAGPAPHLDRPHRTITRGRRHGRPSPHP